MYQAYTGYIFVGSTSNDSDEGILLITMASDFIDFSISSIVASQNKMKHMCMCTSACKRAVRISTARISSASKAVITKYTNKSLGAEK